MSDTAHPEHRGAIAAMRRSIVDRYSRENKLIALHDGGAIVYFRGCYDAERFAALVRQTGAEPRCEKFRRARHTGDRTWRVAWMPDPVDRAYLLTAGRRPEAEGAAAE